jgi:hypothetical protein
LNGWTVVAEITHAVAVTVDLIQVRSVWTVVAGIASAVCVTVSLIQVRNVLTVVAGIGYGVAVSIRLVRVGCRWTCEEATIRIRIGRVLKVSCDPPFIVDALREGTSISRYRVVHVFIVGSVIKKTMPPQAVLVYAGDVA